MGDWSPIEKYIVASHISPDILVVEISKISIWISFSGGYQPLLSYPVDPTIRIKPAPCDQCEHFFSFVENIGLEGALLNRKFTCILCCSTHAKA